MGRNRFYGPHYTNVDLKLSKTISLTERFKLEIRSEVFNILNHPQFKNPAGNLNSPSIFGLSTSAITREDATTSARQIQVAGKITF